MKTVKRDCQRARGFGMHTLISTGRSSNRVFRFATTVIEQRIDNTKRGKDTYAEPIYPT